MSTRKRILNVWGKMKNVGQELYWATPAGKAGLNLKVKESEGKLKQKLYSKLPPVTKITGNDKVIKQISDLINAGKYGEATKVLNNYNAMFKR